MKVLITGATGLVGGGVLIRTLNQACISKAFVLLRGSKTETSAQRLEHLIQENFPPEMREKASNLMQVIPGDLTKDRLGISGSDYEILTENVEHIIHCGANTKFTLPMEELRQFNLEGTRRLLNLGKDCKNLKRFDFVSTAYVAGNLAGEIIETDLDRGQSFSNNYEQSKFETEVMLTEARGKVPFKISIYRPSIIVGESKTGYTPHFRVLYWPMQILDTRGVPFICCNAKAALDVVPSDFVNDSIVALCMNPKAAGQTWHITAGKGNELTVGGLIKQFIKFGAPWAPIVPVWVFQLIEKPPVKYLMGRKFWSLVDKVKPFLSYMFGTGVQYNSDKTHKLLAEMGITPPKWLDYRDNIFSFARDTKWGKAQEQPSYMYIHYGYNPNSPSEIARDPKVLEALAAGK